MPKKYLQFTINTTYHDGRRGGRSPMRGRDDGGPQGGCGGGRNGGSGGNKIPCQVCGKTGHSALRCYIRFDANYNGEEKHVHAATTSYNVNTEWYIDTGTTDHITSDLDKLMMKENKYDSLDQVRTISGSGMPKSHWSIYNS
jgi:hypothetical protein